MDDTIREFCLQEKAWLETELHCVQEEDPQKPHHVLSRLQAVELSVGLYGRTVVTLGKADEDYLPVHRFTTGDEVEIRNKSNLILGGVVSAVTETSIAVALFGKEDPAQEYFEDSPFAVIPKSSVEVHNKMVSALKDLQAMGTNHPVAGRVIHALFQRAEVIADKEEEDTIQPFNKKLDSSQLEAISFALSSRRPIALIHGPVRAYLNTHMEAHVLF